MKKPTRSVSRRKFLKGTATTAVALGLTRFTAKSYAQIAGSNDAIRHCVIGCNDCGRAHIKQFLPIAGLRMVGLCDVDTVVLDQGKAIVAAANPTASPTLYTDCRKALDNKEIDTVSIATPNHWHALLTIWSVQAGKDVYVEKPTCHNVWEGRQAIAAREKYNRIVQAGTQWRSMPSVQQAMAFAKSGKIGKILVSRSFCYKPRVGIGKTTGPQPVPATVDYDLWCGPASNDPPRRNTASRPLGFHYNWHWFWDYGNGDIGNQGAHQMDLARWALDKPNMAPTVLSVGGRFAYNDDGQTPNTLMTVHDYGDVLLIGEVRNLPGKAGTNQPGPYKGVDIGNIIECAEGEVRITQRLAAAYDKSGKEIARFSNNGVNAESAHKENFISVVRSRKREDQRCELAEGYYSSCVSHVSNISHQLGVVADPEAIKAAISDDPAAISTFDRLQEHLAANDIVMNMDQATLGMPLKIDRATQKFIGNDKANDLLTRTYRAGFVVPESV
jgi:predicted dehydrogenase